MKHEAELKPEELEVNKALDHVYVLLTEVRDAIVALPHAQMEALALPDLQDGLRDVGHTLVSVDCLRGLLRQRGYARRRAAERRFRRIV